jgi:hypothetical protein
MYIIYKEVLVSPAIDQRFHPFDSQAMQQKSIHPSRPAFRVCEDKKQIKERCCASVIKVLSRARKIAQQVNF